MRDQKQLQHVFLTAVDWEGLHRTVVSSKLLVCQTQNHSRTQEKKIIY